MLQVLSPTGLTLPQWHTVIPVARRESRPGHNLNGDATTEKLSEDKPPRRSFLDLPLEIRLEIYHWIHLLHPAQERELCPWYPTPKHSAYFLTPMIPSVPWREGEQDKTYLLGPSSSRRESAESICGPGPEPRSESEPSRTPAWDARDKPQLLSPYRPLGYMPSSLLQTGKQVYAEAQEIPFCENEFVFINWFSSGLSAANAFVRGLKPWQRSAMRYARLEMQARDLGDATRLAVWEELCGNWSQGLRGLRLKISMDGVAQEPTLDVGGLPWWPLGRSAPMSWTRDRFRWVAGLQKLTELRALEMEIVGIKTLPNAEKVEWCRVLAGKLNEGRQVNPDRRVKVVSVKRLDGYVEDGDAKK